MARSANLSEKISVGNDREMSLGEVEKFYDKNKGRIEFTSRGFVLKDRIGKESLTVNLSELSSDAVYTLLVSSLGKTGEIYKRFYSSGTPSYEVAEVTSDLLSDKKNYGLIKEIAATDDGKPLVEAIKTDKVKLEDIAKNLTEEQAPGVLKGLQEEVEAKKTEIVTLDFWNNLSESAKYSPDVIARLMSTTGMPLITDNKKFKKYVNKNKMLKAISKRPERLNDFVKAFGKNAIFSDTLFVQQIAKVLKDKAVSINDPKMQTEYINQIKSLGLKAQEYNLDAKAVKRYKFKPGKGLITDLSDIKYASIDNDSKSFKDNILTEKQRNDIMKIAVNHIVKSVDKGSKKATVEKSFEALMSGLTQNKKLKVSAEQILEDKQLMNDLVANALPAAYNKKFFHSNQNDASAKDIAKHVNAFGSELLRKSREHKQAFEEVHALNSSRDIKMMGEKLDKRLPELPQLSDKAKIKMLNKIGKLDFDGKKREKSIKKFDKIVGKNESLMFNDANFIAAISETLHERALKEAIAKPPKGKDVKLKYKDVAAKFKPMIEKVTFKLGQNITNVNHASILSEANLIDQISKDVSVDTSMLPKVEEAKKESIIKTIEKLDFVGKKSDKGNKKFDKIIKNNPNMFNDLDFVKEVTETMRYKAAVDATTSKKPGDVVGAYDKNMNKVVTKFSNNMQNIAEISKSFEDLNRTLSENKDHKSQVELAKELFDEQQQENDRQM